MRSSTHTSSHLLKIDVLVRNSDDAHTTHRVIFDRHRHGFCLECKKEKGENVDARVNTRVCGCVSKKSQAKLWTKWTRFIYPITTSCYTMWHKDGPESIIMNGRPALFVRFLVCHQFPLEPNKAILLAVLFPTTPLHPVDCCHYQHLVYRYLIRHKNVTRNIMMLLYM